MWEKNSQLFRGLQRKQCPQRSPRFLLEQEGEEKNSHFIKREILLILIMNSWGFQEVEVGNGVRKRMYRALWDEMQEIRN